MAEWIRASQEMPPDGVAVIARRTGDWGFEWQRPLASLDEVIKNFTRSLTDKERSVLDRIRLVTLTQAEAVDIRALLSIAIWIRSEQFAQPDCIRVLLDTTSMSRPLVQAQMNRAQQLWKKLTDILGADIPKASWE